MTIERRSSFFTINVATGTTSSAPQLNTINLQWVFLHEVKVRIPAGHNGLTGYAVRINGLHVIPWPVVTAGGPVGTPFVIANAQTDVYEVEAEVDQFLQVATYNTDVWKHATYWTFTYTPVTLLTPDLESRDVLAIV